MANPSSSKHKLKYVAPKLLDLVNMVYAEVWDSPELSKRDRSMITIASLISMRQTEQLRSHLEKGLDNGLTSKEIGELITHVSIYAGHPAAISGALIAKKLLEERGLIEEVKE